MKKTLFKLGIFLLFTAISVVIPFFFEEILYTAVEKFGLGWVMTTILIRLIVIFTFLIGLKAILSLFAKTRSWKNWVIALIGFTPGFFISFAIYPIYNIDYGMLNDNLELPDISELEISTNNEYQHQETLEIVAFLDVGCHYCKIACRKLAINQNHGQKVPISLFFSGEEEDVTNFVHQNGGDNLNCYFMNSEQNFLKFAGFEFPSIFLIDGEGKTRYHWIGDRMNYTALDYLLDLEQ